MNIPLTERKVQGYDMASHMLVAQSWVATPINKIESTPLWRIATVTLCSLLFDTIKDIKIMNSTLDTAVEMK